jgi:hypothetical protein
MASQVKTLIAIKYKDRDRKTVFFRGIIAIPAIIFVATIAQSSFSESESWAAGTAGVIVLPTLLAIVFR